MRLTLVVLLLPLLLAGCLSVSSSDSTPSESHSTVTVTTTTTTERNPLRYATRPIGTAAALSAEVVLPGRQPANHVLRH